jgi:hypothetical protein
VIDNFAPQPYPLECSSDGSAWQLVIGWQKTGDGRLTPVVTAPDGGLGAVAEMAALRYRLADTRPTVQPARTAPPARAPRRESDGA